MLDCREPHVDFRMPICSLENIVNHYASKIQLRMTFYCRTALIQICFYCKKCSIESSTVCIKKRLAFEIQISHNVLNLPDKYNCLESFSES